MRFLLIPFLLLSCGVFAQNTPAEIHYSVLDLLALRYYPFTVSADSIVKNTVERNENRDISAIMEVQKNTVFSEQETIYSLLGKENTDRVLDEVFSSVDLFEKNNDWLLSFPVAPLTSEGLKKYRFYFSAERTMRNQPVYEIAFFPKNTDEKGFSGYLYITADGTYWLVRAFFTLTNPYYSIQDILLTQIFETKEGKDLPVREKTVFNWGNLGLGNSLVHRTVAYTGEPDTWTDLPENVDFSIPVLRKMKPVIHFLLTDHVPVGNGKIPMEWGKITEAISYNTLEGLRLKAGANTTLQLNRHWLFGGSLAYGMKDRQFKYRGEVVYSFRPKEKDIWEFPKRLFGFTYVKDLNIPGEDLLNSHRDFFLYSFSHSETNRMSLQKIVNLYYEQEFFNHFSFQIGGKYLYDQPVGDLSYPSMTRSEVDLSLRYAPKEVFFQNREKRIYLRRGKIELNLNHRIGLQNVFGSDYAYNITDFKAYKKIRLPATIGTADVQFSAGKVWNSVPFPLLFVPAGNQSYIFDTESYNLMDYYEFTTDQFVAGNVQCLFNWSPFSLFSESKIKTSGGIKTIYGPLSDNNNPTVHSGLIPFGEGIKPLGNTPYTEINIGLVNVLRFLRVEWVQRISPKNQKGSIFIASRLVF
ncbi:hypothetical protein AGMMS50262_03280 [Bacteroidia bacterium]|nr:hypothetical protein AGMMS50262_03280 [Bacteroidia bacterium]